MKDKPNDLLLLAGRILAILMQAVLGLAAIAMTIAAPMVIIFKGKINAEIIAEHGDKVSTFPAFQLAGFLAIIAVIMVCAFIFFAKLRHMIESVGDGDPFIPENAERLSLMGWLLLAIQLLGLVAGTAALTLEEWVREIGDGDFEINMDLDIEGLLIVIVLFILARVFKHGAAMRDDLEGTV